MKKAIRRIIGDRCYGHLLYSRHYRRLMALNKIANRPAEGEREYRARWRQLYLIVEPYSYRLFSHFCGATTDIIPEDILHYEIEHKLNPPEHWRECEDKNRFAYYVGEECLPKTVASRSAWGAVDYRMRCFPEATASMPESLILKPAVDTSCGEGVVKFTRQANGTYLSAEGQQLSEAYLNAYGDDFVLQECIEQHTVLSHFCHSSLNTLRLAVYRSLVDGESHVTAAVLRIGREGSVVDNTVAGGRYVGIDIESGRTGRWAFTPEGCPTNNWNGIDLKEEVTVPSWERVKELALYVASRIPHHHLFAMDIAVRADGSPVLIEYNIGGFSPYLYNFTGQTVFGPYTDEVLHFLVRRLK